MLSIIFSTLFPIERLYLLLCHVVSLCSPCTHVQHLENNRAGRLEMLIHEIESARLLG